MNTVDKFGQLFTVWSLTGKIVENINLGTKGFGENKQQIKRVLIIFENDSATVIYTKLLNGEFKINHCEIMKHGYMNIHYGEDCLPLLENLSEKSNSA